MSILDGMTEERLEKMVRDAYWEGTADAVSHSLCSGAMPNWANSDTKARLDALRQPKPESKP